MEQRVFVKSFVFVEVDLEGAAVVMWAPLWCGGVFTALVVAEWAVILAYSFGEFGEVRGIERVVEWQIFV